MSADLHSLHHLLTKDNAISREGRRARPPFFFCVCVIPFSPLLLWGEDRRKEKPMTPKKSRRMAPRHTHTHTHTHRQTHTHHHTHNHHHHHHTHTSSRKSRHHTVTVLCTNTTHTHTHTHHHTHHHHHHHTHHHTHHDTTPSHTTRHYIITRTPRIIIHTTRTVTTDF